MKKEIKMPGPLYRTVVHDGCVLLMDATEEEREKWEKDWEVYLKAIKEEERAENRKKPKRD